MRIDDVVARNMYVLMCKRGFRNQDLAAAMRKFGIDWKSNTVSHVNTGRRSLSILELAGLCAVFNVGLADLLAGDGRVWTPVSDATGDDMIGLAAIRARLLFQPGQTKANTP